MEPPTPAEATAGTTHVNNGPSFLVVEAYGGHDDACRRAWRIVGQSLNDIGTHKFVRLFNLEVALQKPFLFLDRLKPAIASLNLFHASGVKHASANGTLDTVSSWIFSVPFAKLYDSSCGSRRL
jgi:hypothetical protein